MKYIKIYEDTEDPDLVGEEMNALFLRDMIDALHQNGFKTARQNSKNPKIVEVEEDEATQAKVYVHDYLEVILSPAEADVHSQFTSDEKSRLIPDRKKLVIYNKLDLLKFIPITLFYIVGGILFTFPKISEGNWWYLIVFFAPIFILRSLAPLINTLNSPFPLLPKDEAWMQVGKKMTSVAVWFFWILAIPMVYLFFKTKEIQWQDFLAEDKAFFLEMLEFLGTIAFIGASLYLFKGMFHRRVYLNPKAFSAEEIEKIKAQKERSIQEPS